MIDRNADPKLWLAINVRRLAAARGLSLRGLAREALVSKNQLSDVLSGKKDPTLGWLMRLVVPLQVPVHQLLSPPPAEAHLETETRLDDRSGGEASVTRDGRGKSRHRRSSAATTPTPTAR